MRKTILILSIFLISILQIAAAEEPCCYTGSGLSINYIVVKYVGPETLQPGDQVEVHDNQGLLQSIPISPSYSVITYYYMDKEPRTYFKLIRNGQEIGQGAFHTSCSSIPTKYDDQYVESGEDNQRDWELLSIDFVNPGNQSCLELMCGLDSDMNGIGDDCEGPICGNGIIELGEQCDDGNTNNYDSCANDCSLNNCNDCPGEVLTPTCECADQSDCYYTDGCVNYGNYQICGSGYGCSLGPGGEGDIPEFSAVTIILIVLLIGIGVLVLKKK